MPACVWTHESCLTLCNPMDCSPPGSPVHGDSPAKNTGVGCRSLFQGIVPTQGSNLGLLYCRQITAEPMGEPRDISRVPSDRKAVGRSSTLLALFLLNRYRWNLEEKLEEKRQRLKEKREEQKEHKRKP